MTSELPHRWSSRLRDELARTASLHRIRKARTVMHRDGVRCRVDGKDVLNFCSNDYLGLGALPSDVTLDGAGSAHMVSGHFAGHDALCAELCDWLDAEDALLVGNGFMGNLAALGTLCRDGDWCIQDRLNHASMLDAVRAGGVTLARYPHNDVAGAAQQLQRAGDAMAVLATDSVFSMDGDVAPLAALRALCDSKAALFHVDEAHSVGVLGGQGEGVAPFADLRLVTFGKALGSYGAALVGKGALIDYLRQYARASLFTTALPPSVVDHVLRNIRRIRQGDLVAKLAENRAYFRSRTQGLGIDGGESAIFTRVIGEDGQAIRVSDALMDKGYWITAIRPPTVPDGSARLRITLSAAHSFADLDGLVAALETLQ